jgi:hypothetical protein
MISALGASAYAIGYQLERFQRSAERLAQPGGEPDHVRELVEQMSAEHAVKASAKVIRATDEMVGVLFDIVA